MTTSTPTPTARSAEAFRELADVAQRYFDLVYTCNLTLYDQLFHPLAQLFVLKNGTAVSLTSAEYREILAHRQSPESTGAPRREQVHSIDLGAATQALIKLQVLIGQAEFIDYLTLLRGDDGWRIVSKTYHHLSAD
jgi:hypothetical protein